MWLRAAQLQSIPVAVAAQASGHHTALLHVGLSCSLAAYFRKSFAIAKTNKLNTPPNLTGPSVPAWPCALKQAHPLSLAKPHLYPYSKNKMQGHSFLVTLFCCCDLIRLSQQKNSLNSSISGENKQDHQTSSGKNASISQGIAGSQISTAEFVLYAYVPLYAFCKQSYLHTQKNLKQFLSFRSDLPPQFEINSFCNVIRSKVAATWGCKKRGFCFSRPPS